MDHILLDKFEIHQFISSPIITRDKVSSPKIPAITINTNSNQSNRKLPRITNFHSPKDSYYKSLANSPKDIKSGVITPINYETYISSQEENTIQNKLTHKNPKVSRHLPAVFFPETPLSNKNSK